MSSKPSPAGRQARVAKPAPLLEEDDRLPDSDSIRHRDYVLGDYRPVKPAAGKLHPASLLRFALRRRGALAAGWPLLSAVAEHLGRDETVWGVKYSPEGFSWELYFYNQNRNAAPHPKSVTALSGVLSRFVEVSSLPDESLPYFMCSVELDAEVLAGRRRAEFRVYLETGEPPANSGGAGFSYLLGPDGSCRLENHYSFYDLRSGGGMEALRGRLKFSARSGDDGSQTRLLDPALVRARRACYAVKPERDALYFSRVPTEALARWLRRHPHAEAGPVLEAHAEDFSHLLWDVGIDFRAAGREAVVGKVGLYGFY